MPLIKLMHQLALPNILELIIQMPLIKLENINLMH